VAVALANGENGTHAGGAEGVPPLGDVNAAGVLPFGTVSGFPAQSGMSPGFPLSTSAVQPENPTTAQFAFPFQMQHLPGFVYSDKVLNSNSQTPAALSAAYTVPRTITLVENSEGQFVPMWQSTGTLQNPVVLGSPALPTPTTPGQPILVTNASNNLF
jgi:hypothetical protein